jgi:transcriptional regulator with XRE-family HTH domain
MTKSAKQKIGYRIKLARMLKNMDRDDLASRLNVSANYIYKIEAGIGGFSLETIEKFATAIGVEIGFFYDWEEKQTGNERVKDEVRPYGLTEEKIMQIVQETIKTELENLPRQTSNNIVDEIAKALLQLPSDKQKKIIDKLLSEKFKN